MVIKLSDMKHGEFMLSGDTASFLSMKKEIKKSETDSSGRFRFLLLGLLYRMVISDQLQPESSLQVG
jgi:hypothetical protein